MWKTKPTDLTRKLRNQILDLESTIEAKDRELAVAQVEIENMAQVIARDRARVKAEGAAYARKQAEYEGINDEQDIK